MKVGDTVQFKFQGKWEAGPHYPNVGKIIRIDERQVVVKAPAGSKFYLSPDMVRELGKGASDV
jgi:hypothetical protein